MYKICVVILISTILYSCNSVFYQPDNRIYGDPASLAYTMQRVQLPSLNGVKIDVIRFQAESESKGTVVHFHGNAANLTSHLSLSYWLPERGFDLVIFDYQGYGKSQGKPSRAATIADGIAVLNYAATYAKGKPLYILGQSLGGAVGYVAAAKSTQKICAIAIDSSFPSYRHVAKTKLGSWWMTWALQWPLSFLVSDELSPVGEAKNLSIPSLFFHSKEDPVVPYQEGKYFFEIAAGGKEWVDVSVPGHITALALEQNTYRDKLVEFYLQHNCISSAPH